MPSFTTTDFLSSVRRRGSIPTTTNSSNVNSTANLLSLATEELHIALLPIIMSARAEYYVRKKEYSVTANQANYAIPTRATGMVVRDVQLIVSTQIRSLPEIDSEQISSTAAGDPYGYYLEHNNIVLYPTPSASTGTLRIRYFARPGRLAATSDCAQISSIDSGTSTVTVSSLPSTITTATPIDFISAAAPYHNLDIDVSASSLSGTDLTFASLPDGLAVGDWIALAEYSPIPQIPHEFQPVLAQMTVVKALEALGDREGSAQAYKNLEKIQANALQMITPRNQGEPRRVVPRVWRR